MDLMKLQNLLNECIMIEQGNYLGGNFSVDLAEAQAELDQAKQLLIPRVVWQSEQLHKLLQHLSDEDELTHNRTHQQIIDDFKKLV